MRAYFRAVFRGLATTLKGLQITTRHFFRPPFTKQYPEDPAPLPPASRGLHEFEPEKCIACFLCCKACPVDCITIEHEGPQGRNAKITRYEIDYSKCLFCKLCVYPCPTDCIHMGQHFDLSEYRREDTSVDFMKCPGGERRIALPVATGERPATGA